MLQNIKELYENTELTLEQIASQLNIGYKIVWNRVKENYSEEYRRNRKVKNYSKSKTGNKNPMYEKTGEKHHNYIGEIPDGNGYLMILKPDWYTGRKGCKHVFVHHVVMCEALGITEIPKGFTVHHIDEVKTNNNLNNLALLNISAHSRWHQNIGKVQRPSVEE